MVTLEQVEKLRQRANISYDEARAALEKTDGDILEAIINLEKENRISAPEGGGYYSSKRAEQNTGNNYSDTKFQGESKKNDSTSFGEMAGRLIRWCGKIINIGNRNSFEVKKGRENIITVPVTVLVLLLIFTFWITLPLIIIGLFFGYRYMFAGPDLGRDNVNSTLDSVTKAAENLKKEVKDSKNERSAGEDSDNRR